MIDTLTNSLLICIIAVCVIWGVICLLLTFIARITLRIYLHLQMFLITYSHWKSQLWHCINRKALVINYRVFRRVYPFLMGLVPCYSEGDEHYLELRIVPFKWKDTIKSFFCCGVVATVLHCWLKYKGEITSVVEVISDWCCKFAIFEFTKENWVTILAILTIVIMIVRHYKDKYINSVIYQIHDEELKKILSIHKSVFHDVVELRDSIRYNLETMLRMPKSKGLFMPLCWSMENSYPKFSYNEKIKSFELYDGHFRIASSCSTAGYEDISAQLAKIKKLVDDYWTTSPYYGTSAVNKYIRGLSGFDIASFSQRYTTDNIICREYIENICNEFPESLSNLMRSEYSDETKIAKLTELLRNRSLSILDNVNKTICVAIEIDEYIKHFSKAFRLKVRRKDNLLQNVLEKMKP